MKILLRAFSMIHGLMAFMFTCAALMLTFIAAKIGFTTFVGVLDRSAAEQIIEAVGLLAAAVVALTIEGLVAIHTNESLRRGARARGHG